MNNITQSAAKFYTQTAKLLCSITVAQLVKECAKISSKLTGFTGLLPLAKSAFDSDVCTFSCLCLYSNRLFY